MTSKRLLLHIGTGKTGTTSIQEALHRASVDGRLGGICYPQVERHNHNLLAALYRSDERLPRAYRGNYKQQGSEALARDAREFKQELFRSLQRSDKAIISAEYLSGFAPDEVHALREDLARLGIEETLVVVYVRDPASHYLSNVQQSLKAASSYAAPSVYRHPIGRIVRAWGEEFPNFVVRPFTRELLVGGDAVTDFQDVASSFFAIDDGLDLSSTVVNQSVSAEGMVVLQRYRQLFYPDADDEFKRDSTALLRILQRSMGAISQTTPKLSPSVEQEIIRNHRSDLELLREEHGVDLLWGSWAERVDSITPVAESYDGPKRWGDVTHILDSYDEDVVVELLYYGLREALRGNLERYSAQISKKDERITRQNRQMGELRDQLDAILTSRSWRWGHALALILSSPRRLIEAFRRNRSD